MHIRKIICFIMVSFMVLSITSCYKEFHYYDEIDQGPSIYINQNMVFIDSVEGFALYPFFGGNEFNGSMKFCSTYDLFLNDTKISNGDVVNFYNIDYTDSIQMEIINPDNFSNRYSLKFTSLPIVRIIHLYDYIPSKHMIFSTFCLSDPYSGRTLNEYSKMRARGVTSLAYPKKSLKIKLIDKSFIEDSKNVSFLEMYIDDDWILDATYIDQSNMRNRVSFDVWGEIQKNSLEKKYNVLYSAPKGHFVEVFLNDRYHGLFCLNERIDENSLNLHENSLPNNSYLYKSNGWTPETMYLGTSKISNATEEWAGWELKYPLPGKPNSWEPLYDFIEFVCKSSNEEFVEEIDERLATDQAIDFLILINLIQGDDNAGKNLFMVKPNINEPFYIIPWDLDATWGRNWLADTYTSGSLISFKLFDRLLELNPNNFNERLNNRWFGLRSGVLKHESLMSYFYAYYNSINLSGAFEREKTRWPEAIDDISEEIKYIEEWNKKRLEILDDIFYNLK